MKNFIVFSAIISSLLIISCKKEEPKAIFKLDKTELKFSKTTQSNSIIIANIGDAEMEWEIKGLPHWLKAHPVMGSIKPGAKEVTFTTENINNNDQATCELEVVTNGGNEIIDVSLSIKIVTPDIGTKEVYIDQSYESLIENLGEPDFIQFVTFDDTEDYYFKVCGYAIENLFVFFKITNTANPIIQNNLIDQDNMVNMIQFLYPNDVCTKEWIGLGSTIADVQAVFGSTDYFNYYLSEEGQLVNYQSYPEAGIEFCFVDNNLLSLQCITIFKSYTPINQGIIKPEIKQIRNFLPTLKRIVN